MMNGTAITKRCSKCKVYKSIENFYPHRKRWHQSRCKECAKIQMKQYYRRNPEKFRERSRKKYKENPLKYKIWAQRRDQKIRDTVFNHYGGYRCVCCGETEPLFLTLDHINNDGAHARRESAGHKRKIGGADPGRQKGGMSFYRWLIKNNYPSDIQVLCSNCNFGKSRNKGLCPHKNKLNMEKTVCA